MVRNNDNQQPVKLSMSEYYICNGYDVVYNFRANGAEEAKKVFNLRNFKGDVLLVRVRD